MVHNRTVQLAQSAGGTQDHPGPGMITARQSRMLDMFPGPAFVITEQFALLYANDSAAALCAALETDAVPNLRRAVSDSIRTGRPCHESVTLNCETGPRIFDLTILPAVDDPNSVLVTGRDVTNQRNLTNALIASRQMFRDLVTCTAEFVWETDLDGRFCFVSPRGALGFAASELDGRIARLLLLPSADADRELPDGNHAEVRVEDPFRSETPVQDQTYWLRDKQGGLVCMRISSMPIKDTDGKWCGCRGAGHDITEETAQKAHLAKLAAQELVFARIIDGIRQEINPEPLFAIAGRGACEALNSTRIWVGRRCCNNRLEAGYKSRVPKEAEDLLMSWFSIEKDRLDRGYQLTDLSCDDWRLFISPIVSGNSVDGVIMLVRSVRAPDLDQMEKRLLKVLSNHLGVALVQIRAREKLERLSRTDELTGLMNRRAFHEDVSRRLEHGKRTKVPGALLYIDLDDFKPVNDRFGHETGDAVLKGVGELLIRHTRVGDLVARLGGDEFAVWLENIPLSRAIEKAGELQVMCENLSAGLGIENPGLGFSIGVAPVCGAGEESLERLLAAADGAMYRAKQQGKGSCAVAEEAGAGRERK